MTRKTNIPIVKPTETERKIWEYIYPKKTGGMVRQGSAKPDDTPIPSPYLDRRYMIRLSKDFSSNEHLSIRGAAGSWLLAMTLEEGGLSLEQVLSEAIEGKYEEAKGYDPYTLKDFLQQFP